MNVTKNESAARVEVLNVQHSRFVAEIIKGNARVNLTMMSKPFGKEKKSVFWLRTKESIDYINALSEVQKCTTADLLQVRKGGTQETQGTWCNDYRIALRYAQWLSPEFSIAVDDMLLKMMFGDAVMAEVINGVSPIILEGCLWYNYCDVLRSFGLKPHSPSKRRTKLPISFRLIYGRNFVTREYFKMLQKYYDYKNCQLSLTFND